tara:strand:- start:4793 stop:8077 length:3285 start_codon:yes stop_codon:yes gene_type:complete
MGIEKKGLKDLPIKITITGIENNRMENTINNRMENNVSNNKEKMFKTFKLREWPLKNDAGVEVPKWEKLPSFEWKKDDKKKFHLYKHLWAKRSDELLGFQNCGVPTGLMNNIWVLDLDFYVKEGEENGWSKDTCLFTKQFGDLNEYIKKHDLYAVRTISGGTHIYFKYDPEMTQTTSKTSHIDIRADGGYVVSPFTKMNGGEYTFINRGPIANIEPDLKDFVKEFVINKQKKTYKKINKKVKKINPITKEEEMVDELEVDLDVYEFDFTTNLLDKVSKALPDNFFHDREFHVKYATAMKTLSREDVFIKWSKKRCEASDEYEMWPDVLDNNCESVDNHLAQMWNYIGRHNELYMVNYILKEAEKNGLKNARVMLDYYKYKPVPKNTYEPHETINRAKLGHNFLDEYQRKYILAQSDTGTGKTTSFTSHMLKKQKEGGSSCSAPFISVVSRVSLGKEQVRVFKKAGLERVYFHEEISTECKEKGLWWGYFHGDNIVITIDSLMKMKNFPDFNGYTLYLDEYNSLIEYLICVKLLEKNRLEIFEFLTDIMRQADRVIGTDADINEISIRYMEMMLSKMETDDYKPEYFYIKNEYQHNKGIEAKEIYSFNKFISSIKSEDKWMICCDSKTQADIISFLQEEGEYMLITAEGVYRNSTKKWTNETPDLDECDKVIFSPAIVYGLDSLMERPVFCYFKERTIGPNAMVQQIARCRNIKYLRYIFTKKKWDAYQYHDFEQVQDEILTQEKYGVKTLGRIDDETGKKMDCEDKDYTELRAKYEYRADCYNTNKFAHFIKIIRERGFKVNMWWSQTSVKGESDAKKDMKEMKCDQFDTALEEYLSSDDLEKRNNNLAGRTEEETANLYDEWGNIEEYFPKSLIQLNNILKVDYDKIQEYRDLFMTPYLVEDHFHICKFFFNDKHGIKKLLDKKNDFVCNKSATIEAQLLLIEKFRNATGCNEGETPTINDNEINLNMANEMDFCMKKQIKPTKALAKACVGPFLKEYGLVFPRSKFQAPDLTNEYECGKFLVKMYKGVFGASVIKNKKSTKKQPDGTIKSITYYILNEDYFKVHMTLFKYRSDYWTRQSPSKKKDECMIEWD